MEADPKAAVDNPEDGSPSRRRGIGLCLSGGGFRATLFHLGAIRRLFELGITARPDFDTIASVSGGSLTLAQWAIAEVQAKAEKRGIDFDRDIARPIQALTARDIRTGPLAKKFFLPWNWFRGAFAVDAMISKFETAFGTGTLNLLPEHPRFVFCGTDMAFGANFIFDRERVGSYLAGYAPSSEFTLAQAVAASACFPPLFGPMRIDRAAERFKGGRAPGLSAEARKQILSDLHVTDGGVYDNMGLEPVWKSHRVPPRKPGASSAISQSRKRRPAACASGFSFQATCKARLAVPTSEWEVPPTATAVRAKAATRRRSRWR